MNKNILYIWGTPKCSKSMFDKKKVEYHTKNKGRYRKKNISVIIFSTYVYVLLNF